MGCAASSAQTDDGADPVHVNLPSVAIRPSPPHPPTLRMLFNDTALQGNDSADAKGMAVFVEEICRLSGHDPFDLPQREHMVKLVHLIDTNRDGRVDFGEFLHWVAVRCSLPTSEREKWAAHSELHARAEAFLRAVQIGVRKRMANDHVRKQKLQILPQGIRIVFARYDLDQSGFLDIFELKQLMADLQCEDSFMNDRPSAPLQSSSDAEQVHAALDLDHNGEVECDEFVSWIMRGLSRPEHLRRMFSQQSAFNGRLENLLSSLERAALDAIKSNASESKRGNAFDAAPRSEILAPEDAALWRSSDNTS